MSQTDDSTVPATEGTALSAGTLFYLWGDRVVRGAGRLGGVELPSGVKVNAKELSPLVFAASFWQLRETGALQLQEVTKKSLGLFKRQHIQVAFGPHATTKTGYEDAIMGRVSSGATTAFDVVHGWFDEDVLAPDHYVLSYATHELLAAGLARQVDTGRSGVSGFLLGKTKVEPDLAAIATTASAFERVHAGWLSFIRNEPTLAKTLVESCSKAIRSRQESSDD